MAMSHGPGGFAEHVKAVAVAWRPDTAEADGHARCAEAVRARRATPVLQSSPDLMGGGRLAPEVVGQGLCQRRGSARLRITVAWPQASAS